MFDTNRALADMASQIRACRTSDGLTLQQLATRSGVAASTIHKVEARQMVPTVSVLLKIAKGLGCRPEELIRDRVEDEDETVEDETAKIDGPRTSPGSSQTLPTAAADPLTIGSAQAVVDTPSRSGARPNVGVWHIHLSGGKSLPPLNLEPLQRAIVLVEKGEVELQAGNQRVQMDAGDCIEIEGERIESHQNRSEAASLILIVSPPGNLDLHLGQPQPSTPVFC